MKNHLAIINMTIDDVVLAELCRQKKVTIVMAKFSLEIEVQVEAAWCLEPSTFHILIAYTFHSLLVFFFQFCWPSVHGDCVGQPNILHLQDISCNLGNISFYHFSLSHHVRVYTFCFQLKRTIIVGFVRAPAKWPTPQTIIYLERQQMLAIINYISLLKLIEWHCGFWHLIRNPIRTRYTSRW